MASFKKMIVNNTDYDVDDPNDVETDGGELADTVINYDSATTPTIGSFTQFLDRFVSGTKVGAWFKNFRAGCDFLLHIGSLVNNCVSDNETLPLAASQGKILMDLITEANSLIDTLQEKETELDNALATAQSDIASINNMLSECWSFKKPTDIPSGADLDDYNDIGNYGVKSNNIAAEIANMPESAAGTLRVMYATSSSVYKQQIYITLGCNVYMRYHEGNYWQSWKSI